MSGTPDWELIFQKLREYADEVPLPSVSLLAQEGSSPFKILISTIISLRTRDEVTLKASRQLFSLADTPEKMAALSEEEIAKQIFPAGFYNTKAGQIKEISKILIEKYSGQVPKSAGALLSLPGVGQKTANLVLSQSFGINAICVDIHVHRISNRMGWVTTDKPEVTETELMKILPQSYWIETNELLVIFGQDICKSASPLCSECFFHSLCPRIGVLQSR